MKADHEAWKDEWENAGAPGTFYEWLLENIEKNLRRSSCNAR